MTLSTATWVLALNKTRWPRSMAWRMISVMTAVFPEPGGPSSNAKSGQRTLDKFAGLNAAKPVLQNRNWSILMLFGLELGLGQTAEVPLVNHGGVLSLSANLILEREFVDVEASVLEVLMLHPFRFFAQRPLFESPFFN